MQLEGRRVLVTGASSGIGRELATVLAARGARVAVVARREDRLNTLAAKIEEDGGHRPAIIVADLADPGTAGRVGAHALQQLGGLDLLINNAGGGVGGTQAAVGDRVEARTAFEVNFWSPVALTATVLPELRQRDEAYVVNVTSLAQVMTWPMMGHYAASKAALAQATETLRLECAPTTVRVLEVILGPIDTAVQAETRLVPGIGKALSSSPLGTPRRTAARIVRAIERDQSRLVYPAPLRAAYALPTITRRYIARLATKSRDVDPDDRRVVATGSFGSPEAREARARWEQEHTDDTLDAPAASTFPR